MLLKIYLIVVVTLLSVTCRIRQPEVKSDDTKSNNNSFLSKAVLDLLKCIESGDSVGFKKLILSKNECLELIDATCSNLNKNTEREKIDRIYSYFEDRHVNIDTLFAKLHRIGSITKSNYMKIDTTQSIDSLYSTANIKISFGTYKNIYNIFFINHCVNKNGKWYFVPDFYFGNLDFMSYETIFAKLIEQEKMSPSINCIKCDTVMIGLNAKYIDSHTYIFKGDTQTTKINIKNGMLLLLEKDSSRASN